MSKIAVTITPKAARTALRAIQTAYDDIDYNIEYFSDAREKRDWERDLAAADRALRKALVRSCAGIHNFVTQPGVPGAFCTECLASRVDPR